MTTEESVINWLEARGVDCDDARNAMRHVMGYDVSGMDDIASEYRKSCRALCVVAAIRLGVEFKVRTGLATVATYEGRAYIGGNKDNPFDLDPWLALVALVEADNA